MTANDIIKTAMGEVGITEYPANSNKCKYNTAFYGKEVSGAAYPWCCAFVWWVFAQHSPCLVKKTASCISLGQWFKDNGRWSSEPHPGDVVFFKFNTNNRWTNHVGIVKSVQGGTVETIEGNTSVTSQDNGGSVMVRQRISNIVGYGRPAYTSVPKKYRRGMDLSSYQKNVDFAKAKKNGIDFVLLRSTIKDGSPDSRFETFYSGAKSAGIPVIGVYKLCYAKSAQEAQKEAEGVIRMLNGRKCDIWLDMEKDGGQMPLGRNAIAIIITAFLTYCVKKGYDVGIYCDLNYYKNYIKDDIKKICRFWIARHGPNSGMLDDSYKPNVGEVIWQYTSKGRVDGISGNVDLDVM